MIKRVVHFALHQPLFIFLILVIFVGGGLLAFKSLPIEAFPDIGDLQVNVITLHPGRAAEEVEKQVTIPLEVALSGVPNSVRLFSHTQFGLSFVMLTFDDKPNDIIARQQVMERLTGADLPPGVQPSLAPLSSPIGEIFRYRLSGAGHDSRELRTLEDWVVERQIRTVPGVADVVTTGGLVKQYEVEPDLARLKEYNITLQQLFTAIGRGNANAGGSYIERGAQQFLIRGLGLLRSPEDIGNIVVAAHAGTPVLVKHIARVVVANVPPQGIVGEGKSDDIVTGIVVMRKGENPSEVLTRLKERIELLNRSILPKGVRVEPFYDRTWLIDTTLHTVFHNLAEGALLVTFVLLLFLGNLRAASIVALLIPLSLLATFIGLTWRGIPANLLSLGAVDFGIIVDGAVIVVENVFRRLSEEQMNFKSAPERFKHAVQAAAEEVGQPTFFSMLIIIAAHIPIFTLQRHEGRIFSPMAWTVTSALIGSLIFSLTLVPLLCFLLLRKKLPHEDNRLLRFAKRAYVPLLERALANRKLVLICAVVGLGVSLFFWRATRHGLFAGIERRHDLGQHHAAARRVRRGGAHTLPADARVHAERARSEDGTDPKPINMIECFVELKPVTDWRPGMTKEKVLAAMDKALGALPGLETSFSQPIRDNVLESITQIKGEVVVKVFGEDADVLQGSVDRILKEVRSVPGVARAFVDRAGMVPQFIIDVDRERAARFGLNIQDVQDFVETALAGKAATEIWEGEKHFSVVVRLPAADRALDRLKDVLVEAPDGTHIPLAQVADFKTTSGAMNISREGGTRVKAVGVFIQGRDMGSVVKDMQAKVDKLALPKGYLVTWSGEFENQERAMRRLTFVVPVSVFLIFVLLFDAFKSVRSALIILLNVPFALIGGIFALYITGIPLSVSAAIGFIALFGQAVLNGVVMVSHFDQLVEAGKSKIAAVREGAVTRLRTVLMTALLAMLGLLPMALSHGIGSETQRPLAIVIIGGLLSATALTLVVLPVIYLSFAGKDPNEQETVTV